MWSRVACIEVKQFTEYRMAGIYLQVRTSISHPRGARGLVRGVAIEFRDIRVQLLYGLSQPRFLKLLRDAL